MHNSLFFKDLFSNDYSLQVLAIEKEAKESITHESLFVKMTPLSADPMSRFFAMKKIMVIFMGIVMLFLALPLKAAPIASFCTMHQEKTAYSKGNPATALLASAIKDDAVTMRYAGKTTCPQGAGHGCCFFLTDMSSLWQFAFGLTNAEPPVLFPTQFWVSHIEDIPAPPPKKNT